MLIEHADVRLCLLIIHHKFEIIRYRFYKYLQQCYTAAIPLIIKGLYVMLIHMDGFDTYATQEQLWFSGYYTFTANVLDILVGIGTTSGRFGQGALIFGNTEAMLLKNFSQPLTEIWTGIAINVISQTGFGLPGTVMSFLSAVGYEAQITFLLNTGEWAAWWGNGMAQNPPYPPPLATGNYTISANSWHWLEVHYKITTTPNEGIIELFIDGVQVFSNTSANASINSQNVFYSVELGSPQGQIACPIMNLDDWYIIDATDGGFNTSRLGDCRIETLIPTGDAGPNEGTPLVPGPHYEMVNESQNNAGETFITVPGVPSTEEVFSMSPLSSVPANIWGVRVLNIVEKNDGGITYGNAVIRSGSVTAYGPYQQILSGFFTQFGIFEIDPNTNSEWTFDSVNAADAGFSIY